MVYKGQEIRVCRRFHILGTTVTYEQKKHLISKVKYGEVDCPVLDLSRGGVRFVGDNLLKIDSKILVKILFPDDKTPLLLSGRVRWISINPGQSYKYQTGVQFDPFGEKRGLNSPRCLAKLIELEKKALAEKREKEILP